MAVVDQAVHRVLAMKMRLGLFENPFVNVDQASQVFDTSEQRALARRIAQKSIVLLKNSDGILPLSPDLGSIAVIGPNSAAIRHMVGDYAYASMADLMEGGEKPAELTRFPERLPAMISILSAIQRQVSPRTEVRYTAGCEFSGDSRAGFPEAVKLARASDVVVLVVGGKSGLTEECTSGELRDRAGLGLPGVQEELVQAVLETGTPVVLVLVDGRPVAIPKLAERVPAILEAWLPGEEGGKAVAQVLFGEINPGGKLPVSFPRSSGQVPVYYRHKPSGGRSFMFNDYVDLSAKALFPFGHGLSYTSFEYSDLKINPAQVDPEGEVSIEVRVKNTGEREGDEVVQLYVHDVVASLTRPVKELKGFQRVTLGPGETCKLTFTLAAAQLAFYDHHILYVVEPGRIEVMLGSSAEDIRISGSFAWVRSPRSSGRSSSANLQLMWVAIIRVFPPI
jgi:beta-glucosidase